MNSTASRPTARPPDRRPLRAARLGLLAVTSAACLVASAFHAGLTIRVGPLALAEPPILPAAIVEGTIGLALAFAIGSVLARRPWAPQAVLSAYALGIIGFVVGIAVLARNPDMQTPFNVAVHAGVFPLLLVGFAIEAVALRADPSRRTEAS